MNRIKSLALSFGLATLIVAGLSCGAEEKQDQAQDQPGPSGSPGENTLPVTPGGAPLLSLTYEGAV